MGKADRLRVSFGEAVTDGVSDGRMAFFSWIILDTVGVEFDGRGQCGGRFELPACIHQKSIAINNLDISLIQCFE